MRKDLINSLLVGMSIGLIALGIHALTDSSAPHYQLLALALSGLTLFALHLALGLRRARQARDRVDNEADHEPETFLRDRRNPFFRELTRDWTGLDEHSTTHPALPERSSGEARDDRPPGGPDR